MISVFRWCLNRDLRGSEVMLFVVRMPFLRIYHDHHYHYCGIT